MPKAFKRCFAQVVVCSNLVAPVPYNWIHPSGVTTDSSVHLRADNPSTVQTVVAGGLCGLSEQSYNTPSSSASVVSVVVVCRSCSGRSSKPPTTASSSVPEVRERWI